MKNLEPQDMVGEIVAGIDIDEDSVQLRFASGLECAFSHDQDCCEVVKIEKVSGIPLAIVGKELTSVELTASELPPDDWDEQEDDNPGWGIDSETWTKLVLAAGGDVIEVVWRGTSNGYYSEGISFGVIKEANQERHGP